MKFSDKERHALENKASKYPGAYAAYSRAYAKVTGKPSSKSNYNERAHQKGLEAVKKYKPQKTKRQNKSPFDSIFGF